MVKTIINYVALWFWNVCVLLITGGALYLAYIYRDVWVDSLLNIAIGITGILIVAAVLNSIWWRGHKVE